MTPDQHSTSAHDPPPRAAGGVPLISLVLSGTIRVGPASANGPPPAVPRELPRAA